MSATTTLKLPADLKSRVATVAREHGKTPHAFMIEAIEAQAALAERRAKFVASALAAEQEVAEYGLVYYGDEVVAYLRDKFAG